MRDTSVEAISLKEAMCEIALTEQTSEMILRLVFPFANWVANLQIQLASRFANGTTNLKILLKFAL